NAPPDPVLPRGLDLWRLAPESDAPRPAGAGRIRLFGMPTGCAMEPIGIQDDDELPPGTPPTPGEPDGGRLQFAMGNDNPFFDFRQPGDPGGVGFFRLYSQVQCFATGRTGCTLGLQAVTPAGTQYNGLPDGPTFLSPNLAVSHELADGMGLHGFVGKDLRAAGGWTEDWKRGINCGVAVHRPLPGSGEVLPANLFLFVEALGRIRPEEQASGQVPPWKLLPGLHWRLSDNWWVSGAVMVPMHAPRPENGLWHLTCSFQF
ncbi:MAG TPA: hypothetical protein VFA26_00725, partial [Gemmataceae bacterium]|nr:hypothetical protein [Gemmataceae bacterium]